MCQGCWRVRKYGCWVSGVGGGVRGAQVGFLGAI